MLITDEISLSIVRQSDNELVTNYLNNVSKETGMMPYFEVTV